VGREDAANLDTVSDFHDHHRGAAEQVNLHARNPGAAQAVDHFRPDALMVCAIRRDRRRIVAQMNEQHVSRHDVRVKPSRYQHAAVDRIRLAGHKRRFI
jgi:hypothetical protein